MSPARNANASRDFPGLSEIEEARPESSDRAAASPVYRPVYAPDGHSKLGVVTLTEMFERSVKLYGDRPSVGHRPIVNGQAQPYEFITYSELAEVVGHVGSAYAKLGLQPSDRIGVIGPNSVEWMTAMQAMNRMHMVCVPLYDTLGDEAVEYIIKHSEVKLIISAGPKLQSLAKTLPRVKDVVTHGLVYWGDAPKETVQGLKDQGYEVLTWDELVSTGKSNPTQPSSRPEPEDLCTIMYTSGTTGDPKGVTISHRAVLATIAGILDHTANTWEEFNKEDVYLSFLPLAHIFDRVLEELFLYIGGSIGYFQGDIRKITDDIAALKPTVFVGVPRVFERIYNGVMDKVHKGGLMSRLVYNAAYYRKLWYLKRGWKQHQASMISDKLVFNRVKQQLGGRVRVIVSGGAPLSPAVEEFLRVAMCAPVVQGYGLTETCAASFIACPFKIDQMGTVGPPTSQTELRLESVPELGYNTSDDPPAGEVLVRGTGVFSSYYKNDTLTKESFDPDGFFRTGDIGILTSDGALKIVDRKKNMFKLSHGEYIAVERLETVYKHCPLVEQIWIYGNSMESVLVAVVVPAAGPAKEWAKSNGGPNDLKELCNNADFKSHVLSQLRATGKQERLKGFEDVKAIHLESEQFSVDNDTMTPKFSLKRNVLQKKYEKVIADMYKGLKAKPSS